MKNYQIDEVVSFTSGRVVLTEDQARRRKHNIEPVKGENGLFKIINPIQFKVGETVGFDGRANKRFVTCLDDIDEDVAPHVEDDEYADFTKADLQEELASRDIDFKPNANKAELLAMLIVDDAEGDE